LIKSALESCGCSGVNETALKNLRSLSPNKLIKKLGGQGTVADYWRCYQRLAETDAKLFSHDTLDCLKSLRDKGVHLGIVTSSRESIAVTLLQSRGIYDLFNHCLIAYGSCSKRKPHGEPILLALERLAHPTIGAIYIGDAERDALAARNAGIHFGLARWAQLIDNDFENLSSDIELTRISELLGYV
jgi:HAD superfamily hydrolase (TIGR01549 family)